MAALLIVVAAAQFARLLLLAIALHRQPVSRLPILSAAEARRLQQLEAHEAALRGSVVGAALGALPVNGDG